MISPDDLAAITTIVGVGAFVAKMLSLVQRDKMPKWALPVLGGVVFVSLIALWATSALWLFATKGVHS